MKEYPKIISGSKIEKQFAFSIPLKIRGDARLTQYLITSESGESYTKYR